MKKKFFTWFSLSIITVAFMYVAFKMTGLTSTYDGIAKLIVNETMGKTGAINTVTAIVFDFRGYDTLGESFVLFTAITASASILRSHKKKKGGSQH